MHDAVLHDLNALRGLGGGHPLHVRSRAGMVALLRHLRASGGGYANLPARGRPRGQMSVLPEQQYSSGGAKSDNSKGGLEASFVTGA